MKQINWFTLLLALLGSGKLIAGQFGYEISDDTVNEVANGVAAIVTVIGVFMSHKRISAEPQHPFDMMTNEQVAVTQETAPANVSPTIYPVHTYEEIMEKVKDVHEAINHAYNDLQSGKYTQAVEDAQQLYSTIHSFLPILKGGAEDASQKPSA